MDESAVDVGETDGVSDAEVDGVRVDRSDVVWPLGLRLVVALAGVVGVEVDGDVSVDGEVEVTAPESGAVVAGARALEDTVALAGVGVGVGVVSTPTTVRDGALGSGRTSR